MDILLGNDGDDHGSDGMWWWWCRHQGEILNYRFEFGFSAHIFRRVFVSLFSSFYFILNRFNGCMVALLVLMNIPKVESVARPSHETFGGNETNWNIHKRLIEFTQTTIWYICWPPEENETIGLCRMVEENNQKRNWQKWQNKNLSIAI